MIKNKINNFALLFLGIISIILSAIIFKDGRNILRLMTYLVSIILIISSFYNLFLILVKKNKVFSFTSLQKIILNIAFALVIILFNDLTLSSITLFFALYALAISLANIISYYIFKTNNVNNRIFCLFNFIFSFTLTIILFINPYMNLDYVLLYLSGYLFLYGISNIINLIILILPNHFKKAIRVPLPTIMSLIIPKALIREINELIKVDKIEKFNQEYSEPKLFIVIHFANNGSSAFGHMEISFKGKTYSYGNYDMHSRKLFQGIGDGVIMIVDTKKYIDYCIHNKKRYLVEFGLTLTDKEEELIEENIEKLVNTDTVDFYPDSQLYEKGIIPKGEFKDMSSELYLIAQAKFKKITKGKNKTFFVLKSNCSYVVDQIFKNLDKKILTINGIISPGAYYDYLNNSFLMRKGRVVSRKIYMEEKNARTSRSRNGKRNIKKNSSK
ncbi:MAG: DUF308 domain-containing protein [Bacilli bacterium]|nr:DUF308 domain-containing protein [Bacilli bacterium]